MKAKDTAVLTAYTDANFKAEVVNLAKEKEISVSELITSTMKNVIEAKKAHELKKVRGY